MDAREPAYSVTGMDTRTPEQRSHIMRNVRSRHTGPEVAVRKISHAMGLRYRLHRKDLPGTPDLVFPRHHSVVFVNGCFWHGHSCPKGRLPKSRLDFWVPKIHRNRERDAEISQAAAVERMAGPYDLAVRNARLGAGSVQANEIFPF